MPVSLTGPYNSITVNLVPEGSGAIDVKAAQVQSVAPSPSGAVLISGDITASATASGSGASVLPASGSSSASLTVTGSAEDAGGVESGLTVTSTFAQDSVITMGTGAGEVDENQDAVIAFTVPAGWSSGANQGGIVANFGGFSGALVVLDDNGRIFAGTTQGADGDLISTSAAVSGGDRVVVAYELGAVVKAWINDAPVHGTALEEAASGSVDGSSWSGGNDGGYISRTTGTVVDGQQDIATDLASLPSWSSHGTLGTEQAPVGTWADLTYYKGQSVV